MFLKALKLLTRLSHGLHTKRCNSSFCDKEPPESSSTGTDAQRSAQIILRKQISLSVRYYHLQIYKAYSNSNLRDQKVHKTGLLVLGVWILDILTSWHKPDACSLQTTCM